MPNVYYVWGSRGLWDHGLCMAALRGELYPIPLSFKEYLDLPPTDEGAVVVCAANVLRGRGEEPIREFIKKLPWCVFIHTSDEELITDSSTFKSDKCKVWLQQIRPPEALPIPLGDRNILLGWIEGTRETIRQYPRLPLSERPYRWSYSGQINNTARNDCAKELDIFSRGGYGDEWRGRYFFTAGFGQGLPRPEHLRWMTEAAIAPCPSGSFTIETFRFSEALEAGCLPIPNRYAPNWHRTDLDYWKWFFQGKAPFPTIGNWSELPMLFTHYRDHPLALQQDANRAQAWWQSYKRKFALDLVDDCAAFGVSYSQHPITVLIPTSPTYHVPDTSMIEDTIGKIRAYPELADAEIILMIDGVRPAHAHYREDYVEYTRRLLDLANFKWKNVLPLVFDKISHQAIMAREALKYVRSPLVFYCEHDCFPVGEIPWKELVQACLSGEANKINLYISDQIPDEHMYLYPEARTRHTVQGVPLIKTKQYSQRPHLARKDFYEWMLTNFFTPVDKTMIEDRVHGIAQSQDWNLWKTWVYAPEGSLLRHRTVNGRGPDEKVVSDD